ncbi:MAG: hypothetical protein ABI361_14150 [Nitrososphaera sp.]
MRTGRVTAGFVIAIGIAFIAYGVYDILYARPQPSPGGVDQAADVDNAAAWIAGAVVAFGFAGGLFLYAFRSFSKRGEIDSKTK